MLLLFTTMNAFGGAGPWVIGEGNTSIYVGGDIQRLGRLAIRVDGERDVVDVGEGVSTFGVKGIATVGITPRLEVQGTLPWLNVQANRPQGELCQTLGLQACRTTTSVGVIELRAKVLLVDEIYGAPLSLAVGAEARVGAFAYETRSRLTNVGESAFDAGGFVAIGRTGPLASRGYYSAFLDVVGRYRLPNTRTFPNFEGTTAVPGPELAASAELTMGNRRVVAGPVATMLWRITGLDWGEVDLTDPDRFAALRVFTLRAGATAIVRGRNLSASLSILRTVYAQNNPSDVLAVSAGLQTLVRRRRSDG